MHLSLSQPKFDSRSIEVELLSSNATGAEIRRAPNRIRLSRAAVCCVRIQRDGAVPLSLPRREIRVLEGRKNRMEQITRKDREPLVLVETVDGRNSAKVFGWLARSLARTFRDGTTRIRTWTSCDEALGL